MDLSFYATVAVNDEADEISSDPPVDFIIPKFLLVVPSEFVYPPEDVVGPGIVALTVTEVPEVTI